MLQKLNSSLALKFYVLMKINDLVDYMCSETLQIFKLINKFIILNLY